MSAHIVDMKLGEGAKGIAYTVKCDAKDTETICEMLKREAISHIVFYEVQGKFKIKDRRIIQKFIDHLDDAERYAAKTFKRKLFSDRQKVFLDEISGIRTALRLFGEDSAKLTTFMPLRFAGRDIIALEAHTSNGVLYSVFNERCKNTLDNITMKPADIDKMVTDMLRSFVILQKHHMAHTDVKPANIVICEDQTYKLIDWEMMRDLTKRDYGVFKRASASMMFSSPWSNYISGFPAFYAARFITSGTKRRMPAYYESDAYQPFRAHMESEFEHILSWNKDTDYLYDKYANTIDVYSLAATVHYLCWKNGLLLTPYREWIATCTGAHPPKNAKEALKLWRQLRGH
jgi:serine/threonine protein kinase